MSKVLTKMEHAAVLIADALSVTGVANSCAFLCQTRKILHRCMTSNSISSPSPLASVPIPPQSYGREGAALHHPLACQTGYIPPLGMAVGRTHSVCSGAVSAQQQYIPYRSSPAVEAAFSLGDPVADAKKPAECDNRHSFFQGHSSGKSLCLTLAVPQCSRRSSSSHILRHLCQCSKLLLDPGETRMMTGSTYAGRRKTTCDSLRRILANGCTSTWRFRIKVAPILQEIYICCSCGRRPLKSSRSY